MTTSSEEPSPAPEAEIVEAELVEDAPTSNVPAPVFDYTDAGVPTLDYLRHKLDGRLGVAQGSAGLAEAEAARSQADRARRNELDEQVRAGRQAEREQAAADRLAEIRKSLGH